MEQTLKESTKVKSEVLDLKEQETLNIPEYSPEEQEYIKGIQLRLEQSQLQRDRVHDEFDGMTLAQYYDSNEKGAATYIPPKQNKDDNLFVSGTIRQKLFTYLAYGTNLDLSPSITAYDSKQLEIRGLGLAMEDIVRKSEELDNDDEKKMLRQYELLKQGTVFVEDVWQERWGFDKKIIKKFDGKISSARWEKRLKKISEGCTRNIIPLVNVYLGSITCYDSTKQPYMFTVDYIPYYEAKSMYGNWERWKFVSKKVRPMVNDPTGQSSADKQGRGMLYNNWRLTDQVEDMVEVIKYQDKPNHEYAIILNGVLMTPVGLPFPWGYDEYSIVQQNFEPIHNFFAYGRSLVHKWRNNTEYLDEFLRMAILKTQKSFSPARFNLSGRVLSSRIFMPGKMNYGINPQDLPVDPHEGNGMTSPELEMIQTLKKNIDDQSLNPAFAGQGAGQGSTATEILDMQRQSKMVMGMSVFSLSMLEWKLSWIRLYNIIQHWFEPIDTKMDDVRKEINNVYRSLNVSANISGEGMGSRLTVVSNENYTPNDVMEAEMSLTKSNKQPTRITVINPDAVKSAKNVWQIVIIPREKKSNEISKLLFRGMMADIQVFGPDVNKTYLEEEFSEVWDRDPNKLFTKNSAPNPAVPVGQPGLSQPQGNSSVKPVAPVAGLPTPEATIGNAAKLQS